MCQRSQRWRKEEERRLLSRSHCLHAQLFARFLLSPQKEKEEERKAPPLILPSFLPLLRSSGRRKPEIEAGEEEASSVFRIKWRKRGK